MRGVSSTEQGKLLYDQKYEHDACGVGFVADISGHRSFGILDKALTSVRNVTHRGAVSADAKTGDGAGVMTQIPFKLMQRELTAQGRRVGGPEDLAVGMVFLPGQDPNARQQARELIEDCIREHGLPVLGWRVVPVDRAALGEHAAATEPSIQQVMLGRPSGMSEREFGRMLYRTRKVMEHRAAKQGLDDLYLASFSAKTVVYKGLMVAPQLDKYYLDLRDTSFETALAVYHQRYSTNTFPNWYLAQPFRHIAHNGEINTLQGNENWMRAREPGLHAQVWGGAIEELLPVIAPGGSDSAKLDNVVDLLAQSGRDILHTMMMLVPQAWENMPDMRQKWREFYEYHACLTEPWDGPAALAFTDGDIVGACLDRNGLRPARYKYTDDNILLMGSEVGVVDVDDAHVLEKGRLGPGDMIAVDTRNKKLLFNNEIKDGVSKRQPYGQWVHRQVYQLGEIPGGVTSQNGHPSGLDLFHRQRLFGYTLEDVAMVVKAMILDAKEPVFSMGDDTPLSVLAKKPRLLYSFFKQRFAQVTNPPIDPLREDLVMSLDTYIGKRGNLLEETAEHARLVHLKSPILTNEELAALRGLKDAVFKSVTIPALVPVAGGAGALRIAVDALCGAAAGAVEQGASIVILSDRGADAAHAPMPMLLAVGAVHHSLIRRGIRMRASIVTESGEPRDVHHFACLLGYGAAAVNPYLGYETLASLIEEGEIDDMELDTARKNYRKALDAGILKIMSKMGISTVSSYQGGQIFEAIGLGNDLIDQCFSGTTSWISGIGLEELGEDMLEHHRHALEETTNRKLEDHGYYRYRRDGEYHNNSPQMVKLLHNAVSTGNYEDYKEFAALLDNREPMAVRDLLAFKKGRTAIPLEQVEPVENILKRFNSAAMSLGALSPEAHVTLATAMNRIGARSDTGEGGDDPSRYWPTPSGDSPHSWIKQVASGRFGVTPEYLASAGELEIKMAQGSKPGEGGQLPGHKVVAHIAKLRHAVPGIQLISPPPHHDIYSIEDLAQLIYDLKVVNPRARVGVKLVSEAGVGTIAAGVTKGYADTILISGDSGGTGASPLSSIKNAGSPWELGLCETQQVLVLNNLRGRVRLRTDGGLRTGRDVVVAAMMGAEEYGFGTAALIAIGCKMARQCHLNTCPVGVATQKEDLRKKFFGTPEMAVHYFTHVAMDVREVLASLGCRTIDEVVGRTDMLEPRDVQDPRMKMLDIGRVLADPDPEGTKPRRCMVQRNVRPGDVPFDDKIMVAAKEAIATKKPITLSYAVRNVDRTIGTRVSGEIARVHRSSTLQEQIVELRLTGSAGQSLGAFLAGGMRIVLEGEANDYVGKGMAGGTIVVRPSKRARFTPGDNIIMGNTVLYGATAGELFAAGRAGERFGVRNSGATAVVEGVGDHCCEYMTAGTVAVLGETGRNFGAGMTNGVAFVLDEKGDFPKHLNPELVLAERVTDGPDQETLHALVERHHQETDSQKAKDILDGWKHYLPRFWKVRPKVTSAAAPVQEPVATRP